MTVSCVLSYLGSYGKANHSMPIASRARPVIVENDLMLTTELLLIVTVRKNALCPETKSPILVTFETRALTRGECEIQQKATEMTISSGNSASFCVDAASITLGPDETICFIISLDGVPCMLHGMISVYLRFYFFYIQLYMALAMPLQPSLLVVIAMKMAAQLMLVQVFHSTGGPTSGCGFHLLWNVVSDEVSS